MAQDDGYPEKMAYAVKMPILKSAKINGNIFRVEVSQTAKRISFIGQGGKVKRSLFNVKVATYEFGAGDTYIRTEILFPNKWNGPGTRFLLNPVFRYSGVGIPKMPDAAIDKKGTIINRIIAFATLAFFLFNILIFRKKLFSMKRNNQT